MSDKRFCLLSVYHDCLLRDCIIIGNALNGIGRKARHDRDEVSWAESTSRNTAFRNAPVSTGEEITVFSCVRLTLQSLRGQSYSAENGWNHGSAVPLGMALLFVYYYFIKGDLYEDLQHANKKKRRTDTYKRR